MKVGDTVECRKWNGTAFKTGGIYPVTYVWDSGDFIVLDEFGGERNVPPHWLGPIFSILERRLPDPEFDLDDMELAEILMEEMK